MTLHISTKLYDHYRFLVLVFYVWLSYSICHATSRLDVQCVDKERDALLMFKQGIRVDHCGLLDSWGLTPDCCQWAGVRCNNLTGHVTMLRLPGKGLADVDLVVPCLEGTVNASLVELSHLKHLDLSFNEFHFKPTPKFIGSLYNLRYLNLSNTGFLGIIPIEYGNLTRLSYLDLNCRHIYSYNDTSVESLSWVSHLRSLKEINLGGIDMRKAPNWMSIINTLPLLEVLRMDGCKLPTKLPSSLSYINTSTTLHIISLSHNSFHETSIFQWLNNIIRIATSLVYLDLSYNKFTGQIPSFIGKINSLSHLDLGKNNFTGQIPNEIWSIDNLSYLSVSHNRLEGPITNPISNLKHLTCLDLSNNNFHMSKEFMKSLGKLCSLQILRLDNNNIKSELSEVISSLSPCAFKSLVFLSLSNNQVWGFVPNTISIFSSLETLYINNNQLNGTIGEGIGRLSRLSNLNLSSNNLNGVVSRNHFSNLSHLQALDLSYNYGLILNFSTNWTPPFQLGWLVLRSCMLGPSFPKWLDTQINIYLLDISNTGISDIIPQSFWSSMSKNTQTLNISNNNIRGVLPNLSFPQYAQLDMSSNKFSGAIPSLLRDDAGEVYLNNNQLSQGLSQFLCPKTRINLSAFDLSNNLFFEALPDCWGYFPELIILKLQNNKISGNLPPSIFAMESLQILHLHNNSLHGEFPMSLKYSKSLVILDIAYNSMVGSIPPTIGHSLVNLRVLSLKNNHFSKGIPSSICQLTSLQILDLSRNHISGTLPKCLYNLTMMANNTNFPQPIDLFTLFVTSSDLAWFMWERTERSFNILKGLVKGIDISDNNLEGPIPVEITSLVGLQFLNLSRNNLNGAIPSRIGQLTSLLFLDLSRNHLSGNIPTSLAADTFLGLLDLSNNNLSGRIPPGTQLQGFNALAYAGNPELCGSPLSICEGDQPTHIPQSGDNVAQYKENDNDDYIFFVGLIISVVLGLITGFWVVCGTLVLKRSWRHAYFRVCEDATDWLYVTVMDNITRARRRFSN